MTSALGLSRLTCWGPDMVSWVAGPWLLAASVGEPGAHQWSQWHRPAPAPGAAASGCPLVVKCTWWVPVPPPAWWKDLSLARLAMGLLFARSLSLFPHL